MPSPRPRRPLVAAPPGKVDRFRAWLHKFVSNGLALVSLSVAVAILSVSTLTLYLSVDRDSTVTDCRSRISSAVARVEGDLSVEVARGLIALGDGNVAARQAAATKAAAIIVVLDDIAPVRENSVDLCNHDAGFTLDVPAYTTSDK